MSRSSTAAAGILAAALLAGSGALVAPSPAEAAPPGMPDPRQMSGLSRPDPALAPGVLTVRCLLGGFSEPAVDVEVTLRSSTGGEAIATARTDAAGRATFEGLAAGQSVLASAVLGEGEVRSQPIPLRADAGSRVMLVKGAGEPAATGATPTGAAPTGAAGAPAAPAHGGANGGAMDFREGVPFELPADAAGGRGPGTLVVGVVEPLSDAPKPEPGLPITLEIRGPDDPPEATPEIRRAQTDADGRAFFTGLLPPKLALGSKLTVVAEILPDEPARRSRTFEMGGAPLAVIFTPSRALDAPRSPSKPIGPVRAQPPRADASLPPGVLVARIMGGDGEGVAGLDVLVERQDLTGQIQTWRGTTDGEGLARFEGLPAGPDGLFSVLAIREGAPFKTGFFEMVEGAGLRAELRTFPVTMDRSRLKSAVQLEIRPREKNQAQVIQIYEVFVEGDEAVWLPYDLRVQGAEGAHALQVMPQSRKWLDAPEGAPFAVLARPIEPGEIVQLSTAYLMPHDGEASYRWTAPFPVVQATAVLDPELSVTRGAKGPGRTPPHADGETSVQLFDLSVPDWSGGACSQNPATCDAERWASEGATIEMSVGPLPTRPGWIHGAGVGMLAVFLGLVGGGVLLRRRVSPTEALLARRAELLGAIAALDDGDVSAAVGLMGSGAARADLVGALDEVCRKLDSLGAAGHNPAA